MVDARQRTVLNSVHASPQLRQYARATYLLEQLFKVNDALGSFLP